MNAFRHHLLRHRWPALLLVALALLVRFAVPAGYMPIFAGNTVTIALCSGSGPMKMAMPGIAGAADHDSGDHDTGEHGKGEMPCGFAGLAAPFVAGADPIVLALAVAFIVATVFRVLAPRPRALPAYLRPPLRGPPATA
ncbi:DUF2946 family protein [Sphingomonas bacterium]|uniref:DUF2946 family protein n=1 Tax=Sphingomonas bacterium TaxID=1895847 RepID=UPI001576CA7E|nr:DUF2946 family protein [Sphingomonas bacterium]